MQVVPPASDEAAVERGLAALVWDGIFSQALGILTGGTLLVGCALEFGASPGFIGILVAIPFFAQLAQIPAIVLVERVRRRRALCIGSTLLARLMLLPLAAVPFMADRHWALAVLLIAFALLAPLGAVGGCTWVSWTCDLVPHSRLGDIFARRQLRSTISGIVAGLAGGAIVNGWADLFPAWRAGGYTGVFGLAIVAAMASTWCLTRMPEVPMPPPSAARLSALFAMPFRDRNFRRLMGFLGCWQFVTNLTLPFFTLFLVQDLRYPITLAIGLGIVSQLASIAALPVWGRMSDQWSNKTVIAFCAPVLLACPFGWLLAVEPAPPGFTLPILAALQLALGAATAGLDLACGNIAMKLAPRGHATVFLGANGLMKALCAGCAPILGGFLLDGLSDGAAGAAPLHLLPWLLLFLGAAVLGIAALVWLGRIAEPGEVRVGALLGAAARGFAERCAVWRSAAEAVDPPAAEPPVSSL